MAAKKKEPAAPAQVIDENAGIPGNITEQARKADALQKQLIGGTTNPPAAPSEGQPAPAGTPSEEHWKSQHDTLKSETDQEILDLQSDVQRLNDAVWEQSQSIASLLKQNEALRQSGTASPQQVGQENQTGGAPAQPASITPASNLNPDDFEGYGKEIVDLVNQVNALKSENRDLKGGQDRLQRLEDQTAKTAQETMWDYLDRNVTDWEKINKTRPFLEWLGGIDPLSGYKRQQLLDFAVQACEGPRVASFFAQFFAETGQQPAGQEPGPKGELLGTPPILPEETGAGEPPGGPQRPTITKEQFLKAQKDVQTGRMTAEEFEKLANIYQKQQVAQQRQTA